MKSTLLVFTFLSQLLFSGVVMSEDINNMIQKLSKKLGDLDRLNKSVIRGGLRVRLCQYCHGADGNSIKENTPNLAEQNPIYLMTQFEYFRSGVRKNKVMNDLAKGLTEEERINIALYYASQNVSKKVSATNLNSNEYKLGSQLFKHRCISCHGADGHGQQLLPRVAGQKYSFIIKTLTAYKNKTDIRPNSPMIGVSSALSESEIASVAAFVSSMK